MDIQEDELEKMYKWIMISMKPNIWYPIRSDKAYEVIKRLFDEGIIDFCEFNENETHIRKVEDNLLD
jgi:hypothetical protein